MSGKFDHRCAAISAGLAFSLMAVATPQLALAEDAPKSTTAAPSQSTTAAQTHAAAADQPAGERDSTNDAVAQSAGSDQSPAPRRRRSGDLHG